MSGIQQLYHVKWKAWKGKRPSKVESEFLFTACIRQGSVEAPTLELAKQIMESGKKLEEVKDEGQFRRNLGLKFFKYAVYSVGRQQLGDFALTRAFEADTERLT